MAKRFTDTDKWKKPFIRGLEGAYKLLWMYILDDCDHAGIWQVDLEVAQVRLGESLSSEQALKNFGDKVIPFDNGEKWFIPDFIDFQYGELNPENRAHNSVLTLLTKYNLISKKKPLTSPLQGAMDMDKEKDKEQSITISENGSKKFVPPSESELVEYVVANGYDEEFGRRIWKGYTESNWKDSSGKQIKNWKSKCQHVWFTSSNNQFKSQSTQTKVEPPSQSAIEFANKYIDRIRKPQNIYNN